MTPEQQAFENRCWEHYLAERARRTLPGDVDGEPTREGLFWRREDGSYGVLAFNTAWMAYQWGMQALRAQVTELERQLETARNHALEEAAIECDKRAHAGDAGALMAARAIRALKGAQK